jgi:ATP-dependent RNA helicase DeaD
MSTADENNSTESTVSFQDFGLDERIVEALTEMGFETPTPIQTEAMPALMKGHDIIGRARTGSGKTAAFGLPLLNKVKDGGKQVRALVLTPTRELAIQIGEALRTHSAHLTDVHGVTIYGGSPYPPQIQALRRGCSVVVGTPGRVIDLMERGSLDLSALELFVLDEADEMLRMGFIEDVERLLAETPDDRQVALFSATMPAPIRKVASRYLNNPVEVQVEERALSVDHINQHWLLAPQSHKLEALCRILEGTTRDATLVFAKTRAACMDVADAMSRKGYSCDALHGDLGQGARERVLRRFRGGSLKLLIATDVAARGLDVNHLSHVINMDMPGSKESYVHRIGRTGRAGREGTAINLVTPSQQRFLRHLEQSLGIQMKRMAVPSDAQIAGLRRGNLASQVGAFEEPSVDAQRWLSELMSDKEWTAEEVASRALQLLAQRDGVSLAPESEYDTEAPSWSKKNSKRLARERGERGERGPRKERSPEELASFAKTNEVQIFIALGRRHGTRPQDLVGALANETGLSGKQIGRIHISEGASFVGLPKAVATALLAEHSTLLVRGMEATIDLCKTRPPAQNSDDDKFRTRPRSRKFKRPGSGPRKWGDKEGGRTPTRGLKSGTWKIKGQPTR